MHFQLISMVTEIQGQLIEQINHASTINLIIKNHISTNEIYLKINTHKEL